jgi:hypothetical protein
MSENVTDIIGNPVLDALKLAEEAACGGYLAARSAHIKAAARVVSLARLVSEQPHRRDYREAWELACAVRSAASTRTDLAYAKWRRAGLRYDAAWTASVGRRTPEVAA